MCASSRFLFASGRPKPEKQMKPPRHALPGGFWERRCYTSKRAGAQHLQGCDALSSVRYSHDLIRTGGQRSKTGSTLAVADLRFGILPMGDGKAPAVCPI